MRKSKKRVISVITCCFVLAALCVGVFAEETTQEEINPDINRIGTILTTAPYDIGDTVYSFTSANQNTTITSGYYILYVNCNYIISATSQGVWYSNGNSTNLAVSVVNGTTLTVRYYLDGTSNNQVYYLHETGEYYIYVYIASDMDVFSTNDFTSCFDSVTLYSISNRSVIDSVYSNSQDVHNSLVSVINEATNVITTNDVVMMFCILIPVISFGVGILIRLRKRA